MRTRIGRNMTMIAGKVCRLVVTGSDPAKAKKVESWSEAQGNRAAVYADKLVCACQSSQERKLVKQFKTQWQTNRIHFNVERQPQSAPVQPQDEPQTDVRVSPFHSSSAWC